MKKPDIIQTDFLRLVAITNEMQLSKGIYYSTVRSILRCTVPWLS